jgi:tetratricopeptide (TPR) repeat protein
MRTIGPIRWLLLACMWVPLHSSAQSQTSSYTVSVRELSIPPKALRAFEQGMEYLAKKDPAGSLPQFQRAISEFPGYYEAYDRMGAANLKLWRIQEAEQAFRKSIDLSGAQFAHPLLAMGAILDDREQFAEAEALTRKGLDLDPDSWTGHYYLGTALFGLNRPEEAELSVRKSLHQNPNFPEAYLLLADIHSRENDFRSLVSDLNHYLDLAPEGPASARIKAFRESAQRLLLESQSAAALPQARP